MYTVYFIFFQVASATATRFGLSRGLLGLQYDQINESEFTVIYRPIYLSSTLNINKDLNGKLCTFFVKSKADSRAFARNSHCDA